MGFGSTADGDRRQTRADGDKQTSRDRAERTRADDKPDDKEGASAFRSWGEGTPRVTTVASRRLTRTLLLVAAGMLVLVVGVGGGVALETPASNGDVVGDTADTGAPGNWNVSTAAQTHTGVDVAGSPEGPATLPEHRETVVDFDWPGPECPAQEVGELGTYFSGDLGSSDDAFHVDDGQSVIGTPVPPPVPDGGCVLRTESENASIVSVPGGQEADLGYYPERGDVIEFNHYAHKIDCSTCLGIGADFEFHFGVQDAENYYYVRVAAAEYPLELQVGEVENGTATPLDSTNIESTLDGNTYQSVEIAWGASGADDLIEVTFGGQETVSAVSTTYDQGGIGFARNGYQGTFNSYAHLVDRVEAAVGPAVQVVSVDAPETVPANGTLDVGYVLKNVAGETHTESFVNLLVDGELRDWDSDVALAPGETAEGTLTYNGVDGYEPGETIEFTVALEDSGDTAGDTVEVTAPATFEVGIESVTEPVVGEDLLVAANVTNTGAAEGTDTVELGVPSVGQDNTTVQLDQGESTVETLAVETNAADAGTYTATVTTSDDEATTVVEVLDGSAFTVDIVDAADPVEGDDIAVEVAVENTGDTGGTDEVSVTTSPDIGTDSTAVTLGANESTVETLTVPTESGDAGEYTLTAVAGDDTDTADVTVDAPPEFAVEIQEAPDTVAGDNLTVLAEISNVGTVEGATTVALEAGALGTDTTSVTLSGDSTTVETLTVGTAVGDAGQYEVTVSTDDSTQSTPVTVLGPPTFHVDIVETTQPVQGEPLGVTVAVENVGGIADIQPVTLDIDGLGVDDTAVSLDPGGATEETLSVPTEPDDAGTYTATVTSVQDQETTEVTVREGPFLAVDITNVTDPVVGDDLAVTVAVENTGDIGTTGTVAVGVGGLGETTTMVDLDPEAVTTETLTVPTGTGDAGTYTVTAETADDEDSTEATVVEPPAFAVQSMTMDDRVVEGTALEVTVTVHNTGGAGTGTIEAHHEALGAVAAEMELSHNETMTATLGIETGIGQAQMENYTLTVDTGHETVTESVWVHLPSLPESEGPPTNATAADGYEDTDGDGTFGIFDVQALFKHFDEPSVQNHAWAYDFNDDEAVSILDVQSLFKRI